MWKMLSSKEIFKHPRITILEDKVLLPNGRETTYIKYAYEGDAVTIIAKNDIGKILFQKEYSYPPNQELLQLPGGGISVNEDIVKGANRELMEEMDFESHDIRIIGKYLINNRRTKAYMYVLVAKNLVTKSLECDMEENITPIWLSETEIEELIKKGEILNAHTLASWSIYKSSN
jgi:ADP-ribose pyrophosphatase